MTASRETYMHDSTGETAGDMVPYVPDFIIDPIDPDTAEQVTQTLQVYRDYLTSRPALAIVSLRNFMQDTEGTRENSMWKYLTNRERAADYYFDKTTQEAIDKDRQRLQEHSGEDAGVALRAHNLMVFLERYKASRRKLGGTALRDA